MASIEMVQNCHSSILLDTPHSISKLSSLDATLNSPAEGPVLSSAKAPTIEDLNQLNDKLTEVQLSSAELSKDDEFAAHNVYVSRSLQAPSLLMRCPFSQGGERNSFVQNSSVSNLSRFRRDGGTPILTDFTGTAHGFRQSASSGEDAAGRDLLGFHKAGWELLLLEDEFDSEAHFRPLYDESSDDANKTPSTTVNGAAHGSGDDANVGEHPVFHRDGWDAMGDDPTDLALDMYQETSHNAALMKRTSRL